MVLRRDKKTKRKILTTEGYKEYSRYRMFAVNTSEYPESVEKCISYYGSTTVYPMDIYLGVDKLPFRVSVDEALRIAKIGATSSSYMAAAERIKEDFEISISDNEVREIVDYIGEIVLENDKQCTSQIIATYNMASLRISKSGRRPKNGFVLYCQADGAMFNTRKGIDNTDTTVENNKPSTYKENKLGLVFRNTDLINTGKVDENGLPVYRLGNREYIATTKGVDVFRERLVYLLMKNGMADANDVVLISDGASWIRKTREKFFPNATQILDLFHLKENIMSFSQYIFKNKADEYIPWWKSVCKQIEEGKWKEVLAKPEVAVYKDKDSEENKLRNGVVNLYSYIWNNRDYIDYPTYKEKGYFVGSGAIESGNKSVLQTRLKLSGMMWYLDSAEMLIALRSKLKSDLWESEVVPLVRLEYSKRHTVKDSVRDKQRKKHSHRKRSD